MGLPFTMSVLMRRKRVETGRRIQQQGGQLHVRTRSQKRRRGGTYNGKSTGVRGHLAGLVQSWHRYCADQL